MTFLDCDRTLCPDASRNTHRALPRRGAPGRPAQAGCRGRHRPAVKASHILQQRCARTTRTQPPALPPPRDRHVPEKRALTQLYIKAEPETTLGGGRQLMTCRQEEEVLEYRWCFGVLASKYLIKKKQRKNLQTPYAVLWGRKSMTCYS